MEVQLAKPNYSFEKRQRELAKKKKQEEKRQRHARPKDADALPAENGAADAPASPDAAGSSADSGSQG